jgi:hypothetical protein
MSMSSFLWKYEDTAIQNETQPQHDLEIIVQLYELLRK